VPPHPSDRTDSPDTESLESDSDHLSGPYVTRVQEAALETARTDSDRRALAFAGALEPARRVDGDSTVFGVVAASVLADRIVSANPPGPTPGPTAGASTPSPAFESLDVSADPLTVGAALLTIRSDITTDEAAALAGLPSNLVRRAINAQSA
jgi:hypothetical protein